MQLPNIDNVLKDPKKNITYIIMAYRKLTREKMVLAVRHYHSQRKAKKPKRGQTITIYTIIGHDS